MKTFLLVLLLIVLLLIASGYALFCAGIVRRRRGEMKLSPTLQKYSEMINSGISWIKSQDAERIEIPAYDGTRLAALYIRAPQAKGTMILFHGYRTDGYHDFSCAYQYYYSLGYSILNVFQRAHGESGGSYICFGVKERFDCRDWAKYIFDRFGPEHDIFLGGLSMGATTVLMASGLELPESVRGIVADCGFTSPYDEFKEVLKRRYHLPEHSFMDIAQAFSRVFAGFGFNDYSTLTAMRTNTLPILFIHGEADSFVPARFTLQTYEACRSEKELITVPDAGHGLSYLIETEKCQAALKAFLEKHSTCSDTGFSPAGDFDKAFPYLAATPEQDIADADVPAISPDAGTEIE